MKATENTIYLLAIETKAQIVILWNSSPVRVSLAPTHTGTILETYNPQGKAVKVIGGLGETPQMKLVFPKKPRRYT